MADGLLTWFISHALLIVGGVLAVIALAHMLSQRRTPQSIAAWLLLIGLLPWLGVPLYLIFGGRKLKAMADFKGKLSLGPTPSDIVQPSSVSQLLCSLGLPPPSTANSVRLNSTGVQGYESLIELIDGAHTSICYATFILARDEVGRDVVHRLAKRAAEGIQVRLLLDDLGSRPANRSFVRPLVDAGGQVARFMPVLHWPFRGHANLRNHRKLTIIDGKTAWSGGCNTAAEYIGPNPDANRWRDLSFVLAGPAVQTFTRVFESDWCFATGTAMPSDWTEALPTAGTETVQVVPSGPDVEHDAYLGALLTAIYQARSRIWLVTPYFVPPEGLTQALALAAARGVDVRLLLPQVSNHGLADWARGPHMRDLHEAGAKLCMFPTMVHAKAAIFDNSIAFMGSANLDDRSLLLNYELMVAVYSRDSITALEAWITGLLEECHDWRPTEGRIRLIGEGLAEIVAPLL